ncbi:MAG: hypothetical protein IKK11_01505 [Oscillospiraceae bacterium]|nr:hypothetical protein [Oscillospiraceae bacterium]
MEKIVFDSGVRSYKINGGGLLRFNPGDPNVYARFMEAGEKLDGVEKSLVEEAKALKEGDSTAVVHLLQKADREMKQILGWIFGQENDFDKILSGVNLLAVAENGERVVTNLLNALQPVLVEGAERCAREKITAAVNKAKQRRGETV